MFSETPRSPPSHITDDYDDDDNDDDDDEEEEENDDEDETNHNSANFEATTSRFCMVLIEVNDTHRMMMMTMIIIQFLHGNRYNKCARCVRINLFAK